MWGGGGPAAAPAQTGAAVYGSAGDIWNGIADSMLSFSDYPYGVSASGLALNYANGSASSVTLSIQGTATQSATYDNFNPNWGSSSAFAGTSVANLMQSVYLESAGPSTVTLSGLTPSSAYDLVLYAAGNGSAGGRVTTYNVNGVVQTCTYDGGNTLTAGVTYVEYPTAETDASGNLVINLGAGPALESDLNGFQLQAVAVPEPTALALLGVAGMMVSFFRRKVA